MTRARIDIPKDRIAEFCRRHHIRKLALFGSVLREDFSPDSDVDVLVDFEPGHVPGYAFVDMRDELAAIVNLDPDGVDMVTAKFLSPFIRRHVLQDLETLYAA